MDIRTLAKCLVGGIVFGGVASLVIVYVWGVLEYEDWLWMIH